MPQVALRVAVPFIHVVSGALTIDIKRERAARHRVGNVVQFVGIGKREMRDQRFSGSDGTCSAFLSSAGGGCAFGAKENLAKSSDPPPGRIEISMPRRGIGQRALRDDAGKETCDFGSKDAASEERRNRKAGSELPRSIRLRLRLANAPMERQMPTDHFRRKRETTSAGASGFLKEIKSENGFCSGKAQVACGRTGVNSARILCCRTSDMANALSGRRAQCPRSNRFP